MNLCSSSSAGDDLLSLQRTLLVPRGEFKALTFHFGISMTFWLHWLFFSRATVLAEPLVSALQDFLYLWKLKSALPAAEADTHHCVSHLQYVEDNFSEMRTILLISLDYSCLSWDAWQRDLVWLVTYPQIRAADQKPHVPTFRKSWTVTNVCVQRKEWQWPFSQQLIFLFALPKKNHLYPRLIWLFILMSRFWASSFTGSHT